MCKTKSVKSYIRTIPDFPHAGIMFRDVTTLFSDPKGFRMAIDQLLAPFVGMRIDQVVGLEARGFILGGAVAHQLSCGFVPIRRKENYLARRLRKPMLWNMVQPPSKSTTTRSKRAIRSW